MSLPGLRLLLRYGYRISSPDLNLKLLYCIPHPLSPRSTQTSYRHSHRRRRCRSFASVPVDYVCVCALSSISSMDVADDQRADSPEWFVALIPIVSGVQYCMDGLAGL